MEKIITIDGPAGAGKSTVAKITAESLGWVYITTGAVYRTLALLLKEMNLQQSEHSYERLFGFLYERYRQDPRSSKVLIGERDITNDIKTPEISERASIIAKDPMIRDGLLPLQRKIVLEQHGAIVDGRDMGTVVFPSAPLKIFLTASPEIRAERRFLEFKHGSFQKTTIEDLKKEIFERDQRDQEREFSPLKPADDSIIIDSTDKTAEEIRDIILEKAKKIFF